MKYIMDTLVRKAFTYVINLHIRWGALTGTSTTLFSMLATHAQAYAFGQYRYIYL